MSSKGKRSSILKKQNCYPPTDDPVCPVETFSSALKSSRKIEFNRKKSVKEFLVGEDVDTIWGNSYEVSTDGTPSNGLEDATLEHSSCPSTTDEQNKENRVQNKSTASVDESLRRNSNNSTNNSWDLSITISDEEKRGIRNDTSAALSQSLNTTERLRNLSVPSNFLHSSQNAMLKKSIVSGEESEVLPMDVSPMKLNVQPSPTKSPRKMIYNFPKQAMFVEINDIPATLRNGQVADPKYLATISSTDPAQNVVVNNQIEASWLDSATVRSNQTNNLLRRSIEDSTETFNSHPHWNTHLNVTDKANESSDVDTTIALTAAMTKVLESRSNASIYKATNMDLDESTTTVPTNALARARPSFLPSNHSEFIESKNTLHTPSVVMHGRATSLTTNKLEETKPIDISSPLEEHVPRRNMSFENLSILNNMEQSPSDATRMSASVPLKQIIQSDVTSARGDKLAIDFGFSSLSLKLGENSPEVPSATKPRILRPTMPMAMFDAIPDNKETMKSHVNDEINRIRSTKHTARTALTYEKSLVDEMRLRNTRNEIALNDDGSKKSIVAMETSNLERKQSLSTATHVTMHATTTIGMEQSMGPRKQHRSTVIDSEEVQNNPDLQRVQRATMVCNEQMDLTHDEQPVTAATSVASSLSVRETMQDKKSRQSVYNHEPMLDETMAPQQNATGAKGKNLQHIKRETVLGVISMDEMNNDQVQSPQTALNNFRKTHYPRDKVHENAVPVVPDRKTIICNESMMMDVCVTPEQKSGLSCIVYAQNADKLSVHAVGGGGQIDMNIARPTTFQLEPCDESTHMEDNNHRPTMPRRQTVMQTKNMILSEEVASTSEVSSKHPTSRLTEHVIQLMEEDGRPFELPGKRVRQSIHHPQEMETTLPDTDSSRETDLKAPTECYALRKSNLQTIVQQVPIADLEGIELLADDEVVPKEQQQPTVCKRGTIVEVRNMIKSDSSPERRSNHRQTIYDPHGMMEETLPMRSCVKLGQKKSVSVKQPGIRRPTRYSQRISNDYMEETIIPENVRVEHNPKIRLSTFSRDSVALESPIVCQAEHPPSVTKHQPQLRRAIYSTEETVDAPTAVNNAQHRPGSPDKSRQTIQQAACMDMTLGCKEIDTTPSKVQGRITNRRTIYNPILIEETPPYHGSKQPVEQQFRRPRQTILVPQDMDVDDDMPLLKEEERSFALSVLPREATEDCVLRSAPVLSIRGRNEPCNLLQELSIDSHAEFAKPSHLDADEIRSRMVERQTVNANEVRRTFQTQELSDISMPNTTIQAELLPHIGSIVGMESMHEVTELLPPVPLHEQNNSVSVICRVDGQQYEPSKTLNATTGLQPMAFATGVAEIPSEDEFFDAEEEAESHQPVDPLSLTKSRHLTMKFVDVEQLERTKNGTSMLVPATTTKRLHQQVLCSPVVSRLIEEDPLQMTTRVQSSDQIQHTPQGPAKKRPRTSAACTTPPAVERAATGGCLPTSNRHPAPEIEEVVIKEEQQTLSENVRLSQTIIHDPSVFAIEDEDLLDDESNLPCISNEEISSQNGCSTVEPATSEAETRAPQHVVQRPSTNKLTDLSYYRDFANLTIDNLDSWNDEKDDNVPDDGDFVTECISLSDEDSRSVTPPKAPRANSGGKNLCEILKRIGIPPVDPGEVLESTIASEIMNEIRQQHPIVQHPCCGMQEECLCRPRRQLKRDQEYGDLVWDKWSKRFEALLKRIPVVGTQSDQQNVRPQMSLEVHIEELNWQLMRGKLDETFLLMHDEFSKLDISSTTRRSRSPIEGQYPETPSVVFLAENMRSCLVEQTFVDTSPPTGAPLPEIPQILHLIGNKLFCDSGTRWLLDYTEESDKHQLLLRHRTLRSVVVAVQLQPPRSRDHMTRQVSAHWRLERIQVRECQEEYVHSPKLLLAHIEFMRLAKETTERTLRSTYRTVAALMGLWHRFDELLRRVFDAVNRLLTIVRNNEALLCYDAQMERFCVKKYFHRCLDEATLEPNLLQVHFNWIGSIGASGVSYKRPLTDSHKLLPMNGGSSQHAMGANPTKHAVTDDKTGLMFLECLLWNVAKQYHS
ncbi:uncharacterized protein LOC128730154 [Anopheles nili]|uniref:uncharacterized protein LOC128730154 n=1 Tax=Anopheles nili TaxID=185578 RepID=UPI00237A8352|nr:uncharacterized protein LOC128730154 [Anopheles nili]